MIDESIFGLPLDVAELAIFTELTGRTDAPTVPIKEAWLCFGRRTAKTLKAASYASYLATVGVEVFNYRDRLAAGEKGVVQVLAVDRDQAGVCLEYVRAFFEQPLLERMVKRETADSIELNNNITIEITTNDRRRVRGRTVISAIFDEVGHWRSESSVSPDEDVYQSVKPAMVTIPNALLLGISSPYSRRGLLWTKVNEFWSKPGRTLIARAPTWVMNPTLPRDHPDIEQAFADDPQWAEAEYGGQFRTDIESFASREAVEAVTDWHVFERPPLQGVQYTGFLDPSGGSRDSMVAAVCHAEHEIGIVDAIREIKAPFSPASAIVEVLAIPLAVLLIVQYLRFNYAIDAAQTSIETQQENIHYLVDKLGALTHVGGDETSTPEIKNIEQGRHRNADGTLTLIKVIDVLPKQLSAKLTITGHGEGILGMAVRPLRFEARTEYPGIVWQEQPDSSSLPQHHVEIEYPVGRYAVEFKSKDDDVTLDYKFER